MFRKFFKRNKKENKEETVSGLHIVIKGIKLERSVEDVNTHYVTFPDGLRFIFRNCEYAGWYVCGEQEASDA